MSRLIQMYGHLDAKTLLEGGKKTKLEYRKPGKRARKEEEVEAGTYPGLD